MPNAIMLAFTSPTSADTEDGYNDWYDTKHLHDVAGLPGVIAATRYKLAHGIETLPGVTGPQQGYLAIYELEATTEAELADFTQTLRDALADGRADISPTLDSNDLGASLALPRGERLQA